ncbi:MAG: sodium/proline symporter [Planctomycetota bacterium]
MERSTAILLTLLAYLIGLLVLGWIARQRTHDATGFYLGGKTLGPWVTALAANASSSSAWSLVGTSGFAYLHGLSALWLVPGCVGGFVINWFLVAPRLRLATGDSVTLTEFLAGPKDQKGHRAVVVAASLLTLASLLTYVAAQMQAAGSGFAHAFDADPRLGIAIGALVTVAYTLMGGYLAASITDTLQGLLMVAVAVLVPVAAVLHLGGVEAFVTAVSALEVPGYQSPFGTREGLAAAGFAMGLCGIGLGYPGQPHAVNKFMGMAPDASMTVARAVGMSWAVLLYSGMIVLGWAVRVAWPLGEGNHEDAIYEASRHLFPPLVDGIILAAVLAAIMSTVDSQLLTCASCVTHDLGFAGKTEAGMLRTARGTVLAIGLLATVAALLLPSDVFNNVMFAWAALGSAFGPLLLVRLWCGAVAPPWALAAMLVGGGGAIVGFYVPLAAAGFADRVVAWLASGVVAWIGSVRTVRR